MSALAATLLLRRSCRRSPSQCQFHLDGPGPPYELRFLYRRGDWSRRHFFACSPRRALHRARVEPWREKIVKPPRSIEEVHE